MAMLCFPPSLQTPGGNEPTNWNKVEWAQYVGRRLRGLWSFFSCLFCFIASLEEYRKAKLNKCTLAHQFTSLPSSLMTPVSSTIKRHPKRRPFLFGFASQQDRCTSLDSTSITPTSKGRSIICAVAPGWAESCAWHDQVCLQRAFQCAESLKV